MNGFGGGSEVIDYRLATQSDEDEVMEAFFAYMIQDEPCTASRGGYTYRPAGLVDQVRDLLASGITSLAIDSLSGHIVGVALSHIYQRNQIVNDTMSEDEYAQIYPKAHVDLMIMCDDMYCGQTVFDLFPDLSRFCDLFMVGTHPQYRRRGIGTQLVRKWIRASEEKGCQAVTMLATSDYTRKICQRDTGWHIFNERPFEYYRDKLTDRPLFPNVASNKLTAHIKLLRDDTSSSSGHVSKKSSAAPVSLLH